MTGGRFDFADGGSYCGGWEDGKAHGHGICTGPKGQGEYSGSWAHGFEVVGVYTWPSGNTYQGYWTQGKRHGLGVETKGRWCYRGEWTHGFKGRYGLRQSLSSPARYEGTWSNGLQDGYGVETYGDGGTYQGQWAGGMRHGYGVRQSVPFGMATVIRSPLRTSLASLRSEQSNGTILHDISADSPAGTRGGFVLTFHSDTELMTGKKKGFFRRGSLLGNLKLKRSESKSSLASKRSSARSEASMSRISSANSDANSTISFGEGDSEYLPVEDHVDATTTESYMGEWKNDKRSGFGVSERSNGMKYEGEWLNNQRNGYGCTTFPDGTKEEGKYKNNILIRGKKKHLIPIRTSKIQEKVGRATEGAHRAAAIARTKVDIAASRTAHARAKADAADGAAQAASQESDIARGVARELSPTFCQPGLDYIKQRMPEAMGYTEKKEDPPPPQEKKSSSANNSPHFYRKGTTPPHTPGHSPGPTPPPSPPIYKKTSNTTWNKGSSSSVNKDVLGASGNRSSSKGTAKMMTKQGNEWKQPKSAVYPVTTAGNGQLHSAYHSYFVRTDVKLPPEEPEEESNPSPIALGRLPPPPKPMPTKSPVKEIKPEPKLKKQFSVIVPEPKKLLKSQSRDVSVEEVEEIVESSPNTILVILVMLLNIGLAILFVHFLT
ncbi:junctophilin-1-like isoform X1 [Chiloscyllium plagiosum]|uniref:junctophilin-1-like isoform X1 n=2 Tax=Chiloscyllium plagiosum TaxID=36176 RepID=UPI001CB86D12|nr:junctophilin-1-like isoform X1 [Chiloscyllium plagiosum]XP_043545093.1 junctophilin-1-like isoform X1 [Chiloscyllium plagiosum]